MRVGTIIIATGKKYHRFIDPLLSSMKQFFLKGDAEVTPFLFTDDPVRHEATQYYQKDLGYPGATLWRFRTILEREEDLKKMHYLYYIDVDMLFINPVGREIIGNRVGTLHPGFNDKRGTYETRALSLARVDDHEGDNYFCGGFNGGSSEEFLKMSNILSKNIGTDYNNGIVAVWHDESHLNRYFIDNKPTVILDSSYCYPEPPTDKRPEYKAIWGLRPKILALNK